MRVEEMIQRLLLSGFTENWIAKQARISQSTVNRLKSGDCRCYRHETLIKLERIYHRYIKKEESHDEQL